jgi:cell division protein FtsL
MAARYTAMAAMGAPPEEVREEYRQTELEQEFVADIVRNRVAKIDRVFLAIFSVLGIVVALILVLCVVG